MLLGEAPWPWRTNYSENRTKKVSNVWKNCINIAFLLPYSCCKLLQLLLWLLLLRCFLLLLLLLLRLLQAPSPAGVLLLLLQLQCCCSCYYCCCCCLTAAGCWLPTAAYWLLLPLAAGDWLCAVLPYRIVVVVVRNCLLATIAADAGYWLCAVLPYRIEVVVVRNKGQMSYSLARYPLRLPGSADKG